MKTTHTHQEGKYELHITLTEKAELEGWKPSAIDGDPLLGNGVKHYLTTYAASEKSAHEKICNALWALGDKGLRSSVLRAKIEYIVYDVKFDKITDNI